VTPLWKIICCLTLLTSMAALKFSLQPAPALKPTWDNTRPLATNSKTLTFEEASKSRAAWTPPEAASNRTSAGHFLDNPYTAQDFEFLELSNRVVKLDNRIRALDYQMSEVFKSSVTIDTSSSGFQPVNTPVGKLLVTTKDVSRYLDGYKVTLEIGNPLTASISTCDIEANWFITLVRTNKGWNFEEHIASQKTNTFNLATPFPAGYWTEITLNVTPATDQEIKNLSLSFTPHILNLKRPTK